jgi:hypothetical protein
MLSANHPLSSLRRRLSTVLHGPSAPSKAIAGQPQAVERACKEAEKVFHAYTKAKPSAARVYEAAKAFMRGQPLDDFELHLLACGLSLRVKEAGNALPLGHKTLPKVLAGFEAEVRHGDIWRLTWFNLLTSYFAFDPTKPTPAELDGFVQLQAFLERTWPTIDKQNRGAVVPEWLAVLRQEPYVLRTQEVRRYAADYLSGDESTVQALAEGLGITESSWFWHTLVNHCVGHAADQKDEGFRALIPKLITLIRERPALRDSALATLMERCVKSGDRSAPPPLRDYIINKDVWKNPKLKPLGLAERWSNVSDDAWRLALGWVNEGLLRDFFQILAGRHGTDEGRLDFWSRYIDQISWTRLCIGSYTMMLTNRAEIRALIAREEGTYAKVHKDIDAFVAQIGRYIVVEFSTTGNAAYIYDKDQIPFELYAKSYSADTSDLKAGYYGKNVARVTHNYGWQAALEQHLASLGIYPDSQSRKGSARATAPSGPRRVVGSAPAPAPPPAPKINDGQPPGAPFTMAELNALVSRYSRAEVYDGRNGLRGRLKVLNPWGHADLERKLFGWGFKPGSFPREYFYPQN